MKYSLVIAAFLGTISAVRLSEPWDKDSLPECPKDKRRTIMDDQKTHVASYPYVGATCK